MEEQQYLDLVKEVLNQSSRESRNGFVYSSFGPQHIFDLQNGFPLLTTKKMFLRGIIEELLFFLKGQTQTKILEEKGIKIWRENTSNDFLESRNLNYEEGEMGPMYGYNWRYFGKPFSFSPSSFSQGEKNGIDQLKNLIEGLINDPYSRRHLLTTYDPLTVDQCVLMPCHGIVTQFYIEEEKVLHCKTYQRSADIALGYPFNIASYALLLKIIAKACGFKAGKLIITLGDVHIYEKHVEGLREQIKRTPSPFPKIKIMKKNNEKKNVNEILKYIESLVFEDFKLRDYYFNSFIKFVMNA